MNDLLYQLELSYTDRCSSDGGKITAWADAAREFPPHRWGYHRKGLMPSTLFSLVSGDLGLSMMWIVQHVLVHSLLNELSATVPRQESAGLISTFITGDMIGALAHSEDPVFPVTIICNADRVTFEGTKKYITGGLQCDFILLTAHAEKEEKISHLVFVPKPVLPEGALEELDLGMLKSTSHARLRTDEMDLPSQHIVCSDGSLIRRLIKKWGILERALILEAYLGFCAYLASRLKNLSVQGLPDGILIENLLSEQKVLNAGQINLSESSPMLTPAGIDPGAVLDIAKRIEEAARSSGVRLSDDLLKRTDDLGLYRLFS